MKRALLLSAILSGCTPTAPTSRTPSGTGRNSATPVGGGAGAEVVDGIVEGEGEIPRSFLLDGGPTIWVSSQVVYDTVPIDGESVPLKAAFIRGAGPREPGPAIIAVPGRLGIQPGSQRLMQAYVAAGYKVLLIDILGRVPNDFADGDALEKQLAARGDLFVVGMLQKARDHIGRAGGTNVSIIGWDTGGKWAMLGLVHGGDRYTAGINLYGDPTHLIDKYTQIKAPVMNLYAQDDKKFPKAQVEDWQDRFLRSNPPVTFELLSGVQPGFFEPERDTFDDVQAIAVMNRTRLFLKNAILE